MIINGFLNLDELPNVVCVPEMELPPIDESCYVNIVETTECVGRDNCHECK